MTENEYICKNCSMAFMSLTERAMCSKCWSYGDVDRHEPKKGTGLTKAKQEKNERLLLKQIEEGDHEIKVLMKSNKALREDLKLSNLARGRDAEELKDIKSDYRTLRNTVCVECTNQEKLVKENKEMFRWLLVMAGITVITLIGWWLK